jgi:hypothetical protein
MGRPNSRILLNQLIGCCHGLIKFKQIKVEQTVCISVKSCPRIFNVVSVFPPIVTEPKSSFLKLSKDFAHSARKRYRNQLKMIAIY